MARQPRRFVLRLEALSERALPSVVSIQEFSDGTLQVVTDDGDDTVLISDDGTNLPGGVIVQADGQFYFSQGPVTRVSVFTNGGDDVVEYDLAGNLTVSRTVSVNLGAGNDSFTANLDFQTFDAGTDFVVQALGGGGKDRLTLNATGVTVGANAHFTVDLEGGHGKDGVTFNYAPALVDPTAAVLLTTDQRVR